MKPEIHIYSERKPLMRTCAEVLEIMANGPEDDDQDFGDESDPILRETSTDEDTSSEMWNSINPPRG
jgi:hypothetical protein